MRSKLSSSPHLAIRGLFSQTLGAHRVNIHRSRQQDAYLRALKAFVAEKEKEIEAVCGRNYQVRSVSLVKGSY